MFFYRSNFFFLLFFVHFITPPPFIRWLSIAVYHIYSILLLIHQLQHPSNHFFVGLIIFNGFSLWWIIIMKSLWRCYRVNVCVRVCVCAKMSTMGRFAMLWWWDLLLFCIFKLTNQSASQMTFNLYDYMPGLV